MSQYFVISVKRGSTLGIEKLTRSELLEAMTPGAEKGARINGADMLEAFAGDVAEHWGSIIIKGEIVLPLPVRWTVE